MGFSNDSRAGNAQYARLKYNPQEATFLILVSKGKGNEPETFKNYSGVLHSVVYKENVVDDKAYQNFELHFREADESIVISASADTNYGRNLVNTLLSLPDGPQPITLDLWVREKDGRSFPAVSVYQGTERVQWAHEISSLPQPDKVTFKGETHSDYSAQTAFFKEEVSKKWGDVSEGYTEKPVTEPSDLPFDGEPGDELPY
jgi:hypothetical protein